MVEMKKTVENCKNHGRNVSQWDKPCNYDVLHRIFAIFAQLVQY